MSNWQKSRSEAEKMSLATKAEKEFLSLKVGDVISGPDGKYVVAKKMKPALYGQFKDTKYVVPIEYKDDLEKAFKNECGLRMDAYWYGNDGYKKTKEKAKTVNTEVEVWLSGSKSIYPSVKEAKKYMKEFMSFCDPASTEYQRYAAVYFAIEENPKGKIFTDVDGILEPIIKDPQKYYDKGGKTTSTKEDLIKSEDKEK